MTARGKRSVSRESVFLWDATESWDLVVLRELQWTGKFIAKKVDKCGKCDGDGSTCKTIEGHFDERNLSPGYHDVIKLPVGATAIKISEARKSSNNLGLFFKT